MAVKFDEKSSTWSASVSKRHPISKTPSTLRRKGFKSKAEANRARDQMLIILDRKLNAAVSPNWESVVEAFLRFMDETNYTKHTVHCYGSSLRAHTFPIWKDRKVEDIGPSEIRSLINIKLVDKAPSHRQNILKYIRAVFRYALDREYIKADPTPQIKFKKPDKLSGVLTVEQVRKLLNSAKEHDVFWYPIWAFALYTGVRNGEAYAVTWDKVDFENRKILIDSSWSSKDGYKSTKTGDERILEIAPELLLILKELKIKAGESPFVLPRCHAWNEGGQARELKLFLQGLGLPAIRFHDLRATWATMMLSKGTPALKVMAMGGWKDLKTLQIYIRKAGVEIRGITDDLSLHNPKTTSAKVLPFYGSPPSNP